MNADFSVGHWEKKEGKMNLVLMAEYPTTDMEIWDFYISVSFISVKWQDDFSGVAIISLTLFVT